MNQEILPAADAAQCSMSDALILLPTAWGLPVEMTRDNQLQLERELAETFGNPLAALMSLVEIEYREMAACHSRTGKTLI